MGTYSSKLVSFFCYFYLATEVKRMDIGVDWDKVWEEDLTGKENARKGKKLDVSA